MGERPHVVIVGGGFGGIEAARTLRRAPVRVTLVDRNNYHLFQPLLYQVATAALSPADIAHPIRSVLRRQKNSSVLMAEVRGVDFEHRALLLENGSLSYDYLVLATGATHSYFGHPEWSAVAPGLKSVEDALDIRRRVYVAYEAAERSTDPEEQRHWLTFVVVGAGPTGVELAGALAEIGRKTLRRDFRRIDPSQVRVVLVEGGDRVLPSFSPDASAKAQRQLERLGVEVQLQSFVTEMDPDGVRIGDASLAAKTVLWAAGVQASSLAARLGVAQDRVGRLVVDEHLALPEYPEVFAIGDLAHMESGDGSVVPGVAPAAMQSGIRAAQNVLASIEGRRRERFVYRDKGSLATIGRAAAVAQVGRLALGGYLAWLVWWVLHIFFLIGFRNRLAVMFGWAWQYFTWQRGARLITGERPRLPPVEDASAEPPD